MVCCGVVMGGWICSENRGCGWRMVWFGVQSCVYASEWKC